MINVDGFNDIKKRINKLVYYEKRIIKELEELQKTKLILLRMLYDENYCREYLNEFEEKEVTY